MKVTRDQSPGTRAMGGMQQHGMEHGMELSMCEECS